MEGRKGPKGSWKKECRVVPPALMAATPVGATTAIFLKLFSRICLRKVVFPVPAFPVKNTDLEVWLTNLTARSNTGLFVSVSIRKLQFTQPVAGQKKKMAAPTRKFRRRATWPLVHAVPLGPTPLFSPIRLCG